MLEKGSAFADIMAKEKKKKKKKKNKTSGNDRLKRFKRRRYIQSQDIIDDNALYDEDCLDVCCKSNHCITLFCLCILATLFTFLTGSLINPLSTKSVFHKNKKNVRGGRAPRQIQRIELKKYGNFMDVVMNEYNKNEEEDQSSIYNNTMSEVEQIHALVQSALGVPRNSNYNVKCLRRSDLINSALVTDMNQNDGSHFYAPSIHSLNVINEYRRNHRAWYKKMGQQMSMYRSSTEYESLDAQQKRLTIIKDMKLEPYDSNPDPSPSDSIEPIPALCIFQNVAVNQDGNVCDSNNKCLRTKACVGDYGNYNSAVTRWKATYDIVYTISEAWGHGFYHFMSENYLRLFVGLDYLLTEGAAIKIHIRSMKEFVHQALHAVGISNDRIITGNIKTKVLLYPEPIGCGSPSKFLLQLGRNSILNTILSRNIDENKKTKKAKNEITISVIQRFGAREVLNQYEILKALKNENFEYAIDNKMTMPGMGPEESVKITGTTTTDIRVFTKMTMKDSVKFFRETDILIGPHGAGLTNMLYMKTDRSVLEFMVLGKHVNACYMYMALKLNLRYHTFADTSATQNGKMKISTSKLLDVTGLMIKELQEE